MDVRHEQLAGPRALTFGVLGGLAAWALIVAGALRVFRAA